MYRDKKDDGVYQIKLNGITFSVYCDQKTAGGGWTVIGKRSNGGVAFQEKLWEDYKRGFGSLEGEFWLGHEKIHLLTTTRTVQMLVSGDDENKDFIVNYQRFLLGGEDGGYRMFFSDAEPFNIGQFEYKSAFVTRDKDSDHNCAADHGPYWHKDDQSCLKSNLFGEWENDGNKGAQWFGKDNGELRSMEMKTRPTEGK